MSTFPPLFGRACCLCPQGGSKKEEGVGTHGSPSLLGHFQSDLLSAAHLLR